jgi:transposase
MSHSYSLDLRRRIISLIEQGYSRRAAARHFMVSAKFVVNLKRRWDERGTLEPDKQGKPGGTGKLDRHRTYLIGRLEEQPDISMPQLAAALEADHGVKAAPAELSRFLCRAGYSYKKRR